MMRNEKLIKVLFDAIDDVNQQLPKESRLEKSIEAKLYDKESPLDSMLFITFIVAVEQRIEEEFGVTIMLASEKSMGQKNNHFATVEILADYISLLLKEEML